MSSPIQIRPAAPTKALRQTGPNGVEYALIRARSRAGSTTHAVSVAFDHRTFRHAYNQPKMALCGRTVYGDPSPFTASMAKFTGTHQTCKSCANYALAHYETRED